LTWCRDIAAEKNQNEKERSREEMCCEREVRSRLDVPRRAVTEIPDLRCDEKKHVGLRRKRREKGFAGSDPFPPAGRAALRKTLKSRKV
jgi:hypothetical protein